MREFPSAQGTKINFVDTNDILVGFNNSQDCCENFGWFYSEKIPTGIQDRNTPQDLENYFFNKDFFQKIVLPENAQVLDGGGIVVFKLVEGLNLPSAYYAVKNPQITPKEIYLCLYNAHNGYYSHGFNMDVGGETLHSGTI